MVDLLLAFSNSTGIYGFMNSVWGWPVIESIHFFGLCLLIGTVGVFDLRMLGIAKGISMAALHKLVPFGVLGFALNVSSGIMFLTSAPDQYLYNPAFQTKMVFLLMAGINMLLFYRIAMSNVRATPAAINAQLDARIMGAVSLFCWSVVIICGRLITYFRPPYHWCWWC